MHTKPEKTIYLIDASSYLYRAYYSIKPLTAPNGEPVNAVFGFCRMLKKLITSFTPHYLALVWDSKGETARHQEFPAYKETRQAPPTSLFTQKERIIEIADMMGLAQIAQTGVEADDLLYSVAKDCAEEGFTVVVITADKDMGQILTMDHVLMYDPLKEILYDRAAYEQRIGMSVDRILLYFALVGDPSDNIPGVAGVGATSAKILIAQFKTLDALYAHLDTIESKRVRTALETHKSDAYVSEKLFRLRYVATETAPVDLAFSGAQWNHALPLFKQLNFKSLISTETAPISYADKQAYWKKKVVVKVVTTHEELVALCDELQRAGAFACDTETDGRPPLECTLVGISVCYDADTAFYIPCGHTTGELQLEIATIVEIMQSLFADARCKKYLHNTKFDQKVLAQYGLLIEGIAYDTMIAASLVVPDGQRVGLKSLSEYYFNESMLKFDELVDGKKIKTFAQVPIAEGAWYAAIDAVQTYKLVPKLERALVEHAMIPLYTDIELPITQVLYEMECTGISCDTSILDTLRIDIDRRIATIELDICHAAGLLIPINLNSPKQVQELLFKQLKLPPVAKNASGEQSTKHAVLVELAPLHPVPRMLLEHRELAKLKNTYIDALPDFINKKTGRIHTTYNQIGVATGRLSSTDPNLQNIPVGESDGVLTVRSAFKPVPGNLFISADYSQIELRVLAYLSQDALLVEAFKHAHDIHRATAAHLFNVTPEEVSHEQRQTGKRVNFSVLYGVTPFGLSRDMKVPLSEAKQYIERYFATYKGVAHWIEQVIAQTKRDGYVTTHWGRRRYIPAIHEHNKVLFQEACRVAVNTIAQGTAAEIMKLAMIALDRRLKEGNSKAHMLLQIHDEIVVEVAQDQADHVDRLIKETLESVVDWNVGLEVTTRRGGDWQAVSK